MVFTVYSPILRPISSEGVRIALEACEDAFAAVSMYEELSALSDAELERRGVPRQHLFRLVFDRLTRQ